MVNQTPGGVVPGSRPLLLLLAVVLLVAATGCTSETRGAAPPSPPLARAALDPVPDVVGLQTYEAAALLRESGAWTIGLRGVTNRGPLGTVVAVERSSPTSKSVTVVVSGGRRSQSGQSPLVPGLSTCALGLSFDDTPCVGGPVRLMLPS
jgi:hypothetical protein